MMKTPSVHMTGIETSEQNSFPRKKDTLVLKGVRTHNLKNITVEIPLRKLTVIVGVSGSGKSSLALDTLYAEGQRLFMESMSTYARQFIQRMQKPDVDTIEGILPAIAIHQHIHTKNPRSTVGTITEIVDYLRIIFAHASTYECPVCGRTLSPATPSSVWEELKQYEGERVELFSPIETDSTDPIGQMKALFEQGLTDIWEQDSIRPLHTISPQEWIQASIRWVFIVARRVRASRAQAWFDSIELAFRVGKGRCQVRYPDGSVRTFSQHYECFDDGVTFPEPTPSLFSFNRPEGACPECQGFGNRAVIDWNKVIPDPDRTLREHPIQPWNTPGLRHLYRYLFHAAQTCGWPMDVPWRKLPSSIRQAIIRGNDAFFGLEYFFERLQKKRYKKRVRIFLARYRTYETCEACQGTRFRKEVLMAKLHGKTIADILCMPVSKIDAWLDELEIPQSVRQLVERPLTECRKRVRYLVDVGVGYITLDRLAGTLSGGEAQRIQMALALGTALSDTLFILDEPSVGLHPADLDRFLRTLDRLKDQGNTLVVVEHEPSIIKHADHLIELGPGSGERGGSVLFQGTPSELIKRNNTPTARYMQKITLPFQRIRPYRTSKSWLRIRGASAYNLKSIDIDIPARCFTVITGVSGSGKTSLLEKVLYRALQDKLHSVHPREKTWKSIRVPSAIQEVFWVDPSPPQRSPRATTASYLGVLSSLRTWFAQVSGATQARVRPGAFSWNTRTGQCPTCRGLGWLKIDMIFLSDMKVLCDTCKGQRLNREVLKWTWRDMTFADLMNMSFHALHEMTENEKTLKAFHRACSLLEQFGISYLKLGQSLSELSGGELHRLKLVQGLLTRKFEKTAFLIDEPTVGLHGLEVELFVRACESLIRQGHTIIVVEHNLDVIAQADYMIDLGPEGGEEGGYLLFQGWMRDVLKQEFPASKTFPYLRSHIFRS